MASLDAVAGALGKQKAAHLLRRLTFGATRSEIDAFASKTASEAISLLFTAKTSPLPPIDPETGETWIVPGTTNSASGDLVQYFKCWLYGQMFNSGMSSLEKLTFFLHTHFTAISSVVDNATALYYQNQLLRKYALGNFKELALKICVDNAMLILLDNRLNENVKPNENFAREFLELYTIGKGKEIGNGNYTTYTEGDIRAAAKVLSGWNVDVQTFATIDPDTGIPTGKLKTNSGNLANKHDAETKVFSAAFQNKEIKPASVIGDYATADSAKQELKDLVDMIFAQQETAKNICRKIYRFFVYYNITDDIESTIIGPLAQTFIDNNFEIKPVLERLFQSKHFFDLDDTVTRNDTQGAIIKSPLEITIGMMRFFGVTLPDMYTDSATFYELTKGVLDAMEDQGFGLYEPLDVAGYDAYFQAPGYNRNWISPNYLARRYQFAQYLIEGRIQVKDTPTRRLQVDGIAYIKIASNVSDPSNGDTVTRELVDYLLPEAITQERYDFFLKTLLDNQPIFEWNMEWTEYQSSGDDMVVRMQLNDLLNAILQSAEYQLS